MCLPGGTFDQVVVDLTSSMMAPLRFTLVFSVFLEFELVQFCSKLVLAVLVEVELLQLKFQFLVLLVLVLVRSGFESDGVLGKKKSGG
jgi:hypothetical protein